MSFRDFLGSTKCDSRLLMELETAGEDATFTLLFKVNYGVMDVRQKCASIGIVPHSAIGVVCTAHGLTADQVRLLAGQDWVVRLEGSRPIWEE